MFAPPIVMKKSVKTSHESLLVSEDRCFLIKIHVQFLSIIFHTFFPIIGKIYRQVQDDK